MANHVRTTLSFKKINEDGKNKLKELLSRTRKKTAYGHWFGDLYVDGKEGSPTYEETEQYTWTTVNIGPKWCYIEEVDEDYEYLHLESAWDYPHNGLEWLLDQLHEVDNNLLAYCTYEDEAPNFIGGFVYADGYIADDYQIEGSELYEEFEKLHPKIKDMKDEDGELTEEGQEYFYMNFYEVISVVQDENIDNLLEGIS